MRRSLFFVLCGLAMLLCDVNRGYAGSVYLNDEKIESLSKEVVLKNVDVRIDVKGNVFITAKGVKVTTSADKGSADKTDKPKSRPSDKATGGEVAKRYWMVTMQNRVGATQYKVDLFVNRKWTKQVHSKNAQEMLDLTRYLKPGTNRIDLMAAKDYQGGPRISSSAADYYDVLIGEATESQGRILMTKKLVEFRRTAEETDNRQAGYNVEIE
jgi:hypothetical protein